MTRLIAIAAASLLSLLVVAPPAVSQESEATPDRPQTTPEAKAKPAAEKEEAPPDAERITFDLPFPAEQGGGSASGTAGTLEFQRENFAIASDGVEIKYQDYVFRAERMTIDLITREVTADGNVILDQGPRRLTGETLVFDLETKTGRLTEATAYVDPDYYFSGREIAKLGEDEYSVVDGTFTSCEGDVPAWSFRLGRARVEVGGYARIHHARMKVKKAPVLYFPYILWPAKTDRTSGLLLPNMGYSERRGYYLGLAWYQVLGRSYDATFHLDAYSEEYWGGGTTFRYHPTEGTKGEFLGYAIQDPTGTSGEEWRWKVELDHETTDLPFGMRGVVAYRDYSDFEFFQDFERNFDVNTKRSLYSSAFASGSWGNHSFNLMLDDRETFVDSGSTIVLRQLPEMEYRLRSTKLGSTPLYLQVDSSLHYLSQERSETYLSDYGRADLFPRLTLPLSRWPWLTLSLTAGGRATWYGDSLDSTKQSFSGEALTRVLPVANIDVVGPSVSRIFEGEKAKRKHVIEPRWSYGYIGDYDDLTQIPLFDEIDSVRPSNRGRITLVNRLLSKPNVVEEEDEETEEGGEGSGEETEKTDETVADTEMGGKPPAATASGSDGSGREVFSFEVYQDYSFDDAQPLQRSADGKETSEWGPLQARIRFQPSLVTNLEVRTAYNTLFSGLESTSVSGTYGWGKGNRLALTWYTRWKAETGDKSSDQLRFLASVPLFTDKLRLSAQVNYDIVLELWQQQRYVLQYFGECFGFTVEYRDYQAGQTKNQNRDYRFAITLKNVGTFLDLTGGLD